MVRVEKREEVHESPDDADADLRLLSRLNIVHQSGERRYAQRSPSKNNKIFSTGDQISSGGFALSKLATWCLLAFNRFFVTPH
jgi:hypothetical protein